MSPRFLLVIIFLVAGNLRAEQQLRVIYPSENQQVLLVDSTFIFGNVTPGARLWINDSEIPVHSDGGWLAFVDVSPGPFRFHLVSVLANDTLWREWPIHVGPKDVKPSEEYIPREFSPGSKAAYKVGSIFEFSFQAPAGGAGWFYFNRLFPIKMYQVPIETVTPPGDVFGNTAKEKPDTVLARYIGYYTFAEADTGIRSICYIYKASRLSGPENPVVYEDCLDSIIKITPAFPPTVGILSGVNNIIRTGPGMGYKLLYQPPGMEVRITGMRDDFYEISLAGNVTGYVNVDSVAVLPDGAPIPHGEISFITLDKVDNGIEISAEAGVKLPYEISESSDLSQLEVDLFGVTADVDWIRYNVESPLAKMVRWSQPQDGIFRMTVDSDNIWGYKAYYSGTKFVLHLRDLPKKRGFLSGPLKSVKIEIDPGHSSDNGAVGPTGLKEKDANLWIAHELRKMLEARGAEVLMTRYGHEHVPLYKRPDMAEKWGADLLVSIHNNALPDGINPFQNNGTSVYYYFPHSRALAEAIHRHMLERTGLPDHGLYYGNLVLTRYSSAPSVLVECAFMMIPEQEAMLKTDKFQRKCAKAIVEGITDFLKQR